MHKRNFGLSHYMRRTGLSRQTGGSANATAPFWNGVFQRRNDGLCERERLSAPLVAVHIQGDFIIVHTANDERPESKCLNTVGGGL